MALYILEGTLLLMGYDKELRTIRQYIPISVTELDDTDIVQKYNIKGLPVKGVAVSQQTNLMGIRWMPQTLKQNGPKLTGHEIVLNHAHNDVKEVIGKVVHAWYDETEGVLNYYGDVNKKHPSGIADSIDQNYVGATSVSAFADDFRCSLCGMQIDDPKCKHEVLRQYNDTVCEGLVYNNSWIHLGVVTKGADPHATIGVAQSIEEGGYDAINQESIKVLAQMINENKSKLIEQTKVSKMPEDETLKKQLEELEAYKGSMDKILEQMKKESDELKTENKAYKDFISKVEQEKKDELIKEICSITKEEAKEYSDKSLNVLQDIYSTVTAYIKKEVPPKEDKAPNIEQAQVLQTGAPPDKTDEERREVLVGRKKGV